MSGLWIDVAVEGAEGPSILRALEDAGIDGEARDPLVAPSRRDPAVVVLGLRAREGLPLALALAPIDAPIVVIGEVGAGSADRRIAGVLERPLSIASLVERIGALVAASSTALRRASSATASLTDRLAASHAKLFQGEPIPSFDLGQLDEDAEELVPDALIDPFDWAAEATLEADEPFSLVHAARPSSPPSSPPLAALPASLGATITWTVTVDGPPESGEAPRSDDGLAALFELGVSRASGEVRIVDEGRDVARLRVSLGVIVELDVADAAESVPALGHDTLSSLRARAERKLSADLDRLASWGLRPGARWLFRADGTTSARGPDALHACRAAVELRAILSERGDVPPLPAGLRLVATGDAAAILAVVGVDPVAARTLLDPRGTRVGDWRRASGDRGTARLLAGLHRFGALEALSSALEADADESDRIGPIVACHAAVENGTYADILCVTLGAAMVEVHEAARERRALLAPVPGLSAELEAKRRAGLEAVEEAAWVLEKPRLHDAYRASIDPAPAGPGLAGPPHERY